MPVIAAILGAIATGLVYWLIWGKGVDYIEQRWRAGRDAKRDATRRQATITSERLAPLRSVDDPRDGATILMLLVARLRGDPTPEQVATVETEMRAVLGLNTEVTGRLAYARFAASQDLAFEDAVEDVAPKLKQALTGAEIEDLLAMLGRVATVHDGPTARQQTALDFAARRLRAPR